MPGCNGVYTSPSGTISPPTQSSVYHQNLQCEWRIQMPIGERIMITWSKFDLERSVSCRFDSVKVSFTFRSFLRPSLSHDRAKATEKSSECNNEEQIPDRSTTAEASIHLYWDATAATRCLRPSNQTRTSY